MRVDHGDRQWCQLLDNTAQVSNAAAGVDQYGMVAAEHQIDDGVLVMARLGNCEQTVRDFQDVEPIVIDRYALRSSVLKIVRVIHWFRPLASFGCSKISFVQAGSNRPIDRAHHMSLEATTAAAIVKFELCAFKSAHGKLF